MLHLVIPATDARVAPSFRAPLQCVRDGLYVGSTDARAAETLREYGITRVLSFLVPGERAGLDLLPANVVEYRFVLSDGRSPVSSVLTTLHRAVAVLKYEHGEAQQRVLVHCKVGVSRAPVVAAAYLFAAGFAPTMQDALSAVETARPCINPHAVLLFALTAFEKEERVQS